MSNVRKFKEYIQLREAEETQEINDIFNKAAEDIKNLFSQLYKGTFEMVKSYEKASLPEELKNQIVHDLGKIAHKVRGPKQVSETYIINTPILKTENTMIDSYIKNIFESIQTMLESPTIVQDVGSHGTGLSGKKSYDFKSVLTNTYRMVMEKMGHLKDAVLKQIGTIKDTHSKVLGLRNTAGHIRNRLGDIDQRFSKLSDQPLNSQETDKAQDSMIALANAANSGFKATLIGQDGSRINIDPKSEDWKQQVLKSGHKNKMFTLVGPNGQQEEINIGNPHQIHTVLDLWGHKTTSDFVPAFRKNARAFGLRDKDGNIVKEQ